MSQSLRNLFVDLPAAVFAFALLAGVGCAPSAKAPTSAASPDHESALSKTSLHVVEESALPKPPAHTIRREWYSPRESDFRSVYDHDAANQTKESWSDYWYWVQTFYQGNLLSSGWTAEATATLNGVRSEKMRDELRADLNELGRLIASEWSKHKAVRKIDTAALRVFGGRFTQATNRDDGSGRAIQEEIRSARAEVDAKLAGR